MWKGIFKAMTLLLLIGALFGGFDQIAVDGSADDGQGISPAVFGVVGSAYADPCEDGKEGCLTGGDGSGSDD